MAAPLEFSEVLREFVGGEGAQNIPKPGGLKHVQIRVGTCRYVWECRSDAFLPKLPYFQLIQTTSINQLYFFESPMQGLLKRLFALKAEL